RILLVDDEATVLRNLERLLRLHGYDCKSARSAAEARATLDIDDGYSLILTDVNMPGESGIELLEQVAKAHPDIATVMVTGIDDRNLAERALAMGAYGYVIKPFEPNEILIGISNALRRRTLELENRKHRTQLEQMVDERTTDLWDAIRQLETAGKELRLSREETIQRLAVAAEFRDDETGKHIERMSRYCALLARKIGGDYEGCELIRVATVMHDVGKIGIPDSILLKPGPLSSAEFEVMKTHAEIGKMILEGSEAELLQMATAIAATHHEWWDGSGYPSGLNAEEIPLEGRIAAIGDVFDALTSNRVYRKAFTLGEAVEIMKKERGTHFEPFLLDLFFDSIQELVDIKAAH
ncbi:MAG TPA: HD domain-containing phosphohydrolase, partial [Actinomycetota bacterium]|nr:HD domain-containing phosphohydrolase [Actinomycetota bacterium]